MSAQKDYLPDQVSISNSVCYRLLGPVSVSQDGSPLRLGGPKQRTVLAALLLNAGRVVSEDLLMDLLWEDALPASARGQLQVRIWELRNLLGRSAIVRRSSGYRIEVGRDELDIAVFDTVVSEARTELAAGNTRKGVARYREALTLWQGPPLGGVTDVLADREGRALVERRREVLEELFEIELTLGRHTEVIAELRRAVEEFPFSERLHGQLMLALYRAGRAPDALIVYRGVRERLAAELGVEPGAALRELQVRVLTGQEQSALVPAPRAAAERQPVRPAELPADVRGFAGRAKNLALLDVGLAGGRQAADIWVISGIAGVGKTALAVHWARRVGERFPDGQLYVNLRGFDAHCEPMSPSAALAQLLQALGEDLARLPSGLAERAGLFRSLLADRQVLLVLDNARDSAQVVPLLPPTGSVLVTSRHRLGELIAHTDARFMPLDVLPAEDSSELLTSLLDPDLVGAEPAAVAELARLCGHLPLALRIAAANISFAPEPRIAELTAELAHGGRLAALSVDGADESPVARAFAVSYEVLSADLRRMFRLLGLVPGPDFTPEVAAAIGGVGVTEAARQLTMLTAAHLVERHTTGRFRLHDLVREYAVDRARADMDFAARDRAWCGLVEYYLSIVDSIDEWFGVPSPRLPRTAEVDRPRQAVFSSAADAVAWLDREQENLTAVVHDAADRGPFPVAWYLADTTGTVFQHRGKWIEWLELGAAVLAAARKQGEYDVEVLARQSLGVASVALGRPDEAVDHLAEALAAHRATGWLDGEAHCASALGAAFQARANFDEARGHFERALEIHRRTSNPLGEIMVLNQLGFAETQLARLAAAAARSTRALALSEQEGSRWGEAASLVNLAFVHRLRGDTDEAITSFVRARDLHREAGNCCGESLALRGLSLARIDSGAHTQARQDALAAWELAVGERNPEAEAGALNVLGLAELALGRFAVAEEHLDRALEIAGPRGHHRHVADAMCGLSGTRSRRGEHGRAFAAAHGSLAMARKYGLRLVEARCLTALGSVHAGAGERDQAVALWEQAVEFCAGAGLPAFETQARRLLADLTALRP
jgi:DNA-binding SARP family transcriptional activator/tetratricopeptide (TPR) repeat protein